MPFETCERFASKIYRNICLYKNILFFQVLRRFPDCIQADLTYELYQGVFNNVKPFREATVSCMRALAMRFKTITLQANTYVLRQGEGINRLYILGKGSLEVITDGDLKDIIGKYGYKLKVIFIGSYTLYKVLSLTFSLFLVKILR